MSDAEEEVCTLAKNRRRRANAGARMSEMIAAAEQERFIAEAYGYKIQDSDEESTDEEYIPRDLGLANDDNNNDDKNNDDEHSNDGNNDASSSSSSSGSSSASSSDDDDESKKNSNESDSDDDDDDDENDNNIMIDKKKPSSSIKPGSPSRHAYESVGKICSVCLNFQLDDDDEIIECDSCGVSVHESCYGVGCDSDDDEDNNNANDNHNSSKPFGEQQSKQSKQRRRSTIDKDDDSNSDLTEPWFCEPCKRSIRNPYCDMCPNIGGIYKETDTGRWVHVVCALYTPGVTFENVSNLTSVSLFEINHSLWGSKVCSICEDRRLARSGICIECDAGLCKTYFHVTCAQKEGLLFESHSNGIDPYFAQCTQHADKSTIKKQKKTYLAVHARLKKIQSLQVGRLFSESDRNRLKLAEFISEPDQMLSRWHEHNKPPIPFKVSRMLLSSPSAILKLSKKAELSGLDPSSSFMSIQDESEMARQKWHIPPAFDLEYVAYVHDRNRRFVSMQKQNSELISQNILLKTQESKLRDRYNHLKTMLEELRSEFGQDELQAENQPAIATIAINSCKKCETNKDQHLLSLCDTCHFYYHIYCLDPPLTRVPKKTKFHGWQCSDCSEDSD